jgi:ATP-dependent RNA helicase DeaD
MSHEITAVDATDEASAPDQPSSLPARGRERDNDPDAADAAHPLATGDEPEAAAGSADRRTFADLDLQPEILQGLDDMGYERPMPVQIAVYGPMSAGRDIMVQSRTGSGKTSAFGIPIAQRIDAESLGAQALILAPTRELALQVSREIAQIAVHKGLLVQPVYGGAPIKPQIDALSAGAQIIVGTPGRVLDHLRRGTFKPDGIRFLVLDECDEMLSMGFQEEIEKIIEFLPPKNVRQTVLFSATIPDEIQRIARRHMNDPEEIKLSTGQVTVEEISHHYYVVSGVARTRDLLKVLRAEAPESAIIFCNTREETNTVAKFLQRQGYDAEAISSDLAQRDRERVMKRMRDRNLHFLVATDVAARGIDISDLSHVINYTFPESPEVYVHRTGRTGRAGKSGVAISLVGPRELGSFYYLKLIYKIRPEERDLPSGEEMGVLQESERYERVAALVREEPGSEYRSLARRIWQSNQGERIIGVLVQRLLSQHAAEQAAAAAGEAPRPQERRAERAEEPREARHAEREERGEERRRERGRRERWGEREERGEERRRERGDEPREAGREERGREERRRERGDEPREARREGRDERRRDEEGRREPWGERAREERGDERRREPRSERAREGRGEERRREREERPEARREERGEAREPREERIEARREERGEAREPREERVEARREERGEAREPREERGEARREERAEAREPREERVEARREERGEAREPREERGEARREEPVAEPREQGDERPVELRERGDERRDRRDERRRDKEARREEREARRNARREERRRRGGDEYEPTAAGELGAAERSEDVGEPEVAARPARPGRAAEPAPAAEETEAAWPTAEDLDDEAKEFWETWADEKAVRRLQAQPAQSKQSKPRNGGRDETTARDAAPGAGKGRNGGSAAPARVREPAPARVREPAPAPAPAASREDDDEAMESSAGDSARLYVNVGKRENLTASDVRRILGEGVSEDIASRIGSVALRNTHCYVRVPEDIVDDVIAAVAGKKYEDRELVVERARR